MSGHLDSIRCPSGAELGAEVDAVKNFKNYEKELKRAAIRYRSASTEITRCASHLADGHNELTTLKSSIQELQQLALASDKDVQQQERHLHALQSRLRLAKMSNAGRHRQLTEVKAQAMRKEKEIAAAKELVQSAEQDCTEAQDEFNSVYEDVERAYDGLGPFWQERFTLPTKLNATGYLRDNSVEVALAFPGGASMEVVAASQSTPEAYLEEMSSISSPSTSAEAPSSESMASTPGAHSCEIQGNATTGETACHTAGVSASCPDSDATAIEKAICFDPSTRPILAESSCSSPCALPSDLSSQSAPACSDRASVISLSTHNDGSLVSPPNRSPARFFETLNLEILSQEKAEHRQEKNGGEIERESGTDSGGHGMQCLPNAGEASPLASKATRSASGAIEPAVDANGDNYKEGSQTTKNRTSLEKALVEHTEDTTAPSGTPNQTRRKPKHVNGAIIVTDVHGNVVDLNQIDRNVEVPYADKHGIKRDLNHLNTLLFGKEYGCKDEREQSKSAGRYLCNKLHCKGVGQPYYCVFHGGRKNARCKYADCRKPSQTGHLFDGYCKMHYYESRKTQASSPQL